MTISIQLVDLDDHNLVIHGFGQNTDLETVSARKNTGSVTWFCVTSQYFCENHLSEQIY